MNRVSRWLRPIVISSLCSLFAIWLFAEVRQWVLRWEAQRLLGDLQSIRVEHSTAREANAALRKSGEIQSGCREDQSATCYSQVLIRFRLPEPLCGSPDQHAKNWLPRAIDHFGLRCSGVGAMVITEHGVVTEKSFFEEVNLPVRDWYLRGGAYVPSLAVSSNEALRFRESELSSVAPSHPLRYAHRYKGPYGLGVQFLSAEEPSEKASLMAFQFSCITRFLPCSDEREVLPSGAKLLEEQ
jgi:hypothetical protein